MKNLFLLVLLVLAACIQGPWDYQPENNTEYRGIYTEGTLIADRPIRKVCFEKLLMLGEYYTDDFAFYKESQVSVSGPRGTAVLAPQVKSPNCFDGAKDFIIERGASYDLTATFLWDSAGVSVETTYKATANIPTLYKISDTATVNEEAFTNQTLEGNIGSPEGLLELVQGLPQEGQDEFIDEYGVLIGDFTALLTSGDTLAAVDLFTQNGQKINNKIDELYKRYEVRAPYSQGDTVYYLTGGLNTTSHYFHFDYSEDIASTVISQTYSEEGAFGLNSFTEAFQDFGLDAAGQYFAGTTRRLIHYPNFYDPTQDLNILDSLPVTNTYLVEGLNTLYFYGYEQAMTDYILTYVDEHTNPKVRKRFNIEGGRGIFAGAIVDSFQVYIQNPEGLREWTIFETTAGFCEAEGWNSNLTCLEFEVDYCRQVGFDPQKYVDENKKDFDENRSYSNCVQAAMRAAIEDGVVMETYTDQNPNTKDYSPDRLEDLNTQAWYKYCTENFFQPAGCAEYEEKAHQWTSQLSPEDEEANVKLLKNLHWKHCKSEAWQEPTCNWAHRAFCVEQDINSTILCEPAQEWCQSQTNEIFCQKEPGT